MNTKTCGAVVLTFVLMSSAVCSKSQSGVYDIGFPEGEKTTWNGEPSSNNVTDPWGLEFEPSVQLATEPTYVAEAAPTSSKWESPANNQTRDRWQFEISPYVWVTGVKGFLGVNDRGSSYDLDIGDVINLLDEVEMMAFGSLKAKKNRTSFFIDFIYSKMDNLTTGDLGLSLPPFAQNDLDLKWEEMFIQFGGGYTICEWTTSSGRDTSLDIQGGGRYLYVSGNDEIIGGPNDRIHIGLDGSENFIEPWIGAMLETDLSKCTTLLVGGDIGGFGHGETVDTNWQYYAKVQYQLSPQMTLDAGFRHMKLEYEDSVSGRAFTFEQEVYGPTVGVTFKF